MFSAIFVSFTVWLAIGEYSLGYHFLFLVAISVMLFDHFYVLSKKGFQGQIVLCFIIGFQTLIIQLSLLEWISFFVIYLFYGFISLVATVLTRVGQTNLH